MCKDAKQPRKDRRVYVLACQRCGRRFASHHAKRKNCESCWQQYKLDNAAELMTCVNCGKKRRKSDGGGNSRGLFCSRKCTNEYRRKASQRGLKEFEKACAKAIDQEKREREASARKRREAIVEACRRIARLEARRCRACGSDIAFDRKGEFCCEECKLKHCRALKPKGSKKHTTRARKKSLPRSYGREMSIEAVGDRDGWICRLCGGEIKDRAGRRGPLAPCVDHIVPLNHPANTRHGHVENNVQIAHRQCNELKGCTVACPSLFECDNPKAEIVKRGISQAPQGGKLRKNKKSPQDPTAARR